MFCRYCGQKLDAGSRFCGSCGKPVAEPGEAAPAHESPAAPVHVPPAAPSHSASASPSPALHPSQISQTFKRHRPPGLIFIALLSILSGLLSIMGGLIYLGGGYSLGLLSANPLVHLAGVMVPVIDQTRNSWIQDATTEGFVVILLGVGYLFVAVNLFRLQEWTGRILGIVFSVVVALHSADLISTGEGSVIWHVISIGFNAWIIYYLCKASVRRNFDPAHVAAVPRVS